MGKAEQDQTDCTIKMFVCLEHAKDLMHQANDRYPLEVSPFWMVSIVENLAAGYPRATLKELRRMIRKEMPEVSRAYQEYLKFT